MNSLVNLTRTSLFSAAKRAVNVSKPAVSNARFLSHHEHHDDDYHEPELKLTPEGAFIVENTAFTLEWVLSSPPPLHQFEEPPIIVEWPEGESKKH